MRWHWQFTVPLVLILFSVDWVLMPLLKSGGMDGWQLFILTSILATIELVLWYWFWKWFRKVAVLEFARKAEEDEAVQEAVKLGREIRAELQMAGAWNKVKNRSQFLFFETYKKYTDEDNRLMKKVRRGGNIAMLLLGLDPYPGGRTFGTILCGTTGWKSGLYPLAIGNILRVGYMVGFWNILFRLF